MIIKSGDSRIFIKNSKRKFHERLQFNANGISILIAEKIKNFELQHELETTVGSSHWITEESDFYRFDKVSFELSSLFLNIPCTKSTEIELFSLNSPFIFDLSIENANGAFFMPSMEKLMFDFLGRNLICFHDIGGMDKWIEFNLSLNFSIFIHDESVVAYKLSDPLLFLIGDFSDELDEEPPTSNDYLIFNKVLSILSGEGDIDLLSILIRNGYLASFTGYNRMNNMIDTCGTIVDNQW